MRIKQLVILTVSFILPIGIFIFLKTMGKNEFAVQAFYQEGLVEVPTNCKFDYTIPYRVSNAILNNFSWSRNDSLTLYLFSDMISQNTDLLEQVLVDYTHPELGVFQISTDSVSNEIIQNVKLVNRDVVSINELKQCHFLIDSMMNSVLIDSKRIIRGYYDLNSRNELDRLSVELRIILKR
jgi:hypothetical protein